jgi:hypothetical protein
MTAGPGGTLKADLAIDMPGERTRLDPRYNTLYERIHGMVRDEVERARLRRAA